MTRQEAIEEAAALMPRQDICNADLIHAIWEGTWGQLAGIVLDKTGRTDLADAIWEGGEP